MAVERISEMETLQSDSDRRCIECEELKAQVAKLEDEKISWEAKQEATLLERASLVDQVAKLEEEVGHLNDRMGA